MRNELHPNPFNAPILKKELLKPNRQLPVQLVTGNSTQIPAAESKSGSTILFITSYPPRECGIATYSQDLMKVLNAKFGNSFSLQVCALETENEKHLYGAEVKFTLNTSHAEEFAYMAKTINRDRNIKMVVVQHEFGFFNEHASEFQALLNAIAKPIVLVFHTVLPNPNPKLKKQIEEIVAACDSIIVMTNNSARLLKQDYDAPDEKISIIPHGTHLVKHLNKQTLKEKYGLKERKVISTFGLLSSGKGIETTLKALPEIIQRNPDVLFLIIGKTHPGVVQHEGERYRDSLKAKIEELGLEKHVQFINRYLALPDLLEYLQLTDIYLFTSRDPNQAVSGTFSYAISCGCPIISTPIPHAKEVLGDGVGVVIDFDNAAQLAENVNRLFADDQLRKNLSLNGLHRIAASAWENSAIAHALLFKRIVDNKIALHFRIPEIKLDHVKAMTTDFGMIQFSKINEPDIESGYTLDDNARALIVMCQQYERTGDAADLEYVEIYLNFIQHCLRQEGYFSNYVSERKYFTEQNNSTNLADANGRAVWALGYLISKHELFSEELVAKAEAIIAEVLPRVSAMHSTRAMAFVIKGLYYCNLHSKSEKNKTVLITLANRLVQMYRHEANEGWEWFESYLTYANAILPEAMLCAYSETGDEVYKQIGKTAFDFLLSHLFKQEGIKVISNKSWMQKGKESAHFGEQPIDVAYTILALSRFFEVFGDMEYKQKMETAFSWFLGNNHLHQIIYNPCTGGCYDGLEEDHVNLNQGAESTLSYLLARMTIGKYFKTKYPAENLTEKQLKQFHKTN